jgi:hypothetical protein
MSDARIVALYISPAAGAPMQPVREVEAIQGAGLKGDRYCAGEGSWSKGEIGHRQVSLINSRFFHGGSHFGFIESRRNIVTIGVELMKLIGKDFKIDEALFHGVKYCDPCERPGKLAMTTASFKESFADCGGLIAEVIQGGIIRIGGEIISPS